jgi:hypothetical protein
MAGFPFGWLTELADPSVADPTAADAAQAIVRAELAQADRISGLDAPDVLAAVRRSSERGLLRAARSGRSRITADKIDKIDEESVRRLLRDIADGWQEIADRLDDFRTRYQLGLDAGRDAVRRRFSTNEDLRGMLFSLNPGSYEAITHWLDGLPDDPAGWRTKDRSKFDPLALYLQRACAKNDSTGRAGPFAVGRFDNTIAGVRETPTPLRHHVFLARWAAEAMLTWMAESMPSTIAAAVPPRLATGVDIAEGSIDHLVFDHSVRADVTKVINDRGRRIELSAFDRAVLLLCDGDRTPAEIRAAMASGTGPHPASPAEVDAALTRLADKDLVVRAPTIPYGVEDPLPLLEHLAALDRDSEFANLVGRCRGTVEAMASGLPVSGRETRLSALNAAFTGAVGQDASRNHGGFYEDRALIYEESSGRFGDLVLGEAISDRVQAALPLIVNTFLFVPRHRLEMENTVLVDWFSERFTDKSVSVNDYLRAFAQDQGALRAAYAGIDAAVEGWGQQLKDAAIAAMAGRGRADLEQFLDTFGLSTPVVCDIDLMFAGNDDIEADADALSAIRRLVVSEVHSDEELLTHGMFSPFVAEQYPALTDEVLRGYQRLLRPDEIIVDVTVRHFDKTFARRTLDCPEIEVGDRSPMALAMRRRLAGFEVELCGDRLRLRDRDSDRYARLITLPFAWLGLPYNPMAVFGFPKRTTGVLFGPAPGETLPEISFDDILLSRKSWSIRADQVAAKNFEDGFLALQRLRHRLGLPRHVFARTSAEGKPIYVDLDSPLLVRQILRFAARADIVTLSEMTPGPAELWARRGSDTFTSELRFGVFDPGQI